jgi:hypothetical protein
MPHDSLALLVSQGGVPSRKRSYTSRERQRFCLIYLSDNEVPEPDWGVKMDQVLKKVIEKRDTALREAESWENWLKAYEKLVEPLEPLDVLLPRTTLPQIDNPQARSTSPPRFASRMPRPRAARV